MTPDAQLAPRVLLAVPDDHLRRIRAAVLRDRGFSVSATTDPSAAVLLAESFGPDVIVVDLRLSAPHGGSLFERVQELADTYVIALAQPDAEAARIRALRAGADTVADDTVTPDELAARCEALLRRPRRRTRWDPTTGSLITFGPLVIDVGRRTVSVHGHDVSPTRLEFTLLVHLCRDPTRVVTREELIEEAWGPNWVGDIHVVDVHLSNLRRKLQLHAPDVRFIDTVRGQGFRASFAAAVSVDAPR